MVLSGKGTVVLPQGGHGVAEKTWVVVHVSRRTADVTRRKLVVFIVKLIWKINVGDVILYIVL